MCADASRHTSSGYKVITLFGIVVADTPFIVPLGHRIQFNRLILILPVPDDDQVIISHTTEMNLSTLEGSTRLSSSSLAMRWWLILLAILLGTGYSSNTEERCSVCTDPTIPVPQPDATVDVPDFGTLTCGELQNTLPLILKADSESCRLIQSVGSICGCPMKNVTNPCGDFCEIPDELRAKVVSFRGQQVTCELVQISLSNMKDNSMECTEGKALATECGCGGEVNVDVGNNANLNNNTLTDEQCTPCWDGSDFTLRDKDITRIMMDFPLYEIPEGFNVTCSTLLPLFRGQTKGSFECEALQAIVGGLCGCPKLPNGCNICPNDDTVPNPDDPFVPTRRYLKNMLTCGETYSLLGQVPADDSSSLVRNFVDLPNQVNLCRFASEVSYACGCNGGMRIYFGADTDLKRSALAWAPRVAGLISLLCSIFILYDITASSRKKGVMSVANGLVCGLSVGDVITSCVWIASTAPIQKTFQRRYGDLDSRI